MDDFIWLRAVTGRSLAAVVARGFTFPQATPFEEPTPFWRPLSDIFFFSEHRLFGLRPAPYHATNLVMHALVAGLGGIFVARLSQRTAVGLVTAALFAVAPSFDFAVTWVSQFSELLGAVLVLTALLSYRRYLAGPRSRTGTRLWLVSMVALTLALLAKESAVIGLLLLPLLAIVTPPSEVVRSRREVMLGLLPVGFFAAVYGAFLLVREYLDAAGGGTYELGPHVARNMFTYLEHISVPYARDHGAWVKDAQRAAAAAYIAIGVVALASGRRAASFLFIWSILALVPFSLFKSTEWRYAYLATLPFIAFLATMTAESLAFFGLRIEAGSGLLLGAGLVALALGSIETRQQQAWIAGQGQAWRAVTQAMRQECAGLPPNGHIWLVGSPAWDYYGVSSRSAANMFLDHVYVDRGEPPGLAAFLTDNCVLDFAGGRWVRRAE